MSNIHTRIIKLSVLIFSLNLSAIANADWSKFSQPSANAIRSFAIQNGVIFCCSNSGGVFGKTGEKFVAKNLGLELNSYEFLAMANIGNTLFAAHYNKGVFRLNENSMQWVPKNYNGLTTTYIKSLLVKENRLFAGTEIGVFLTTDNGDNWDLKNIAEFNEPTIVSLGIKGANIFAGTDEGKIYRSDNNGDNWTQVAQGLTYVRSIAAHGGVVFAAGDKVYKSDASGANWTAANDGLNGILVRSLLSENNGNLLAGTNMGLYISTNNGDSWIIRNLADIEIYSLMEKADGTIYAGCDKGKIFSSEDDFNQFVVVEKGTERLPANKFMSIDGRLLIGTDGSGVFSYHTGFHTVNPVSDGLTHFRILSLAQLGGNHLFAGSEGSEIFNWDLDQAATWSLAGNLSGTGFTYDLHNRLGKMFAAKGGSGIYEYNQQTQSWSNTSQSLGGIHYSLTSKGNKLYAGSRRKAYVKNGEQAWEEMSNGLPESNGDLVTLLTTEEYIYAGLFGSSREIYRTPIENIDWEPYENINGLNNVSSLIRSGKLILAGTSKGVYIMKNENGNWIAKNEGFEDPAPDVKSIVKEGKNYWAAASDGVWRMPISDLSVNIEINATLQGPHSGGRGSANIGGYIDTVKFNLRSSFPPYAKVDSTVAILNELDTGTVCSFELADDGSYYIEVDHRNSLETWSSIPINLVNGQIVNYDFTSSPGQAYGFNMVYVDGSWCIYSGDINKDGAIDGSDVGSIDNDAYNFLSGYVITDLNADGFVDASDMFIADNNAANFVTAITP